MKSHLKVKVYSLSTEMTFIRKQEEKWKNRARAARAKQAKLIATGDNGINFEKAQGSQSYAEQNFWSQRWHREPLKLEARSSHLAYGFMKGRSYQQMEHLCYGDVKGHGSMPPNWTRIEEIVIRFSKDEPEQRDIMQKFGAWLAAAKVWYEGNPERIAAAKEAREAEHKAKLADASYQKQLTDMNAEAERYGRQTHEEGWRKVNGRWRNINVQANEQASA